MGSFERKLKRNKERERFNSFTGEWADARAAGHKVDGRDMGRKPGFGEFKRRIKLHEEIQKLEQQNKQQEKLEAEKKLDLEWKDE